MNGKSFLIFLKNETKRKEVRNIQDSDKICGLHGGDLKNMNNRDIYGTKPTGFA